MTDDGTFGRDGTLRMERILPGPLERVWEFLTDPEKRALWLAGGTLEPRVGGTLTLVFRNDRLSPIEEAVPERYRAYDGARFTGRVTKFEPPVLLAHTWDATEVRFELSALPDGRVRLVLTQTGIVERDERTGALAGWHTHLDILDDRLAGRTPRPFWSTHEAHERRTVTR